MHTACRDAGPPFPAIFPVCFEVSAGVPMITEASIKVYHEARADNVTKAMIPLPFRQRFCNLLPPWESLKALQPSTKILNMVLVDDELPTSTTQIPPSLPWQWSSTSAKICTASSLTIPRLCTKRAKCEVKQWRVAFQTYLNYIFKSSIEDFVTHYNW